MKLIEPTDVTIGIDEFGVLAALVAALLTAGVLTGVSVASTGWLLLGIWGVALACTLAFGYRIRGRA